MVNSVTFSSTSVIVPVADLIHYSHRVQEGHYDTIRSTDATLELLISFRMKNLY